jgi:hypothetical protein
MDAQAIKTLGGICQMVGVLIVVRDLLAIHDYLGDLGRVRAWLRARWAWVEAAVRRLLGRPGRSVVVHATAASAIGIANSVTARVTPGAFVPQPEQPLQEQLAAQAGYLNRLRDWMVEEVQQRDEALKAEREQARAELRAERERLERVIGEARKELERLRKLATSGTASRWLGVPVLLAGVAFSTWPDGWAQVWPAWLSVTVLGFLVICCVAVGLGIAIEMWLRRDGAAA